MKISQSKISELNCLNLVTADAASVTVMLLVGSGAVNDREATAGSAHFLEHMMFKATKKRNSSLKIAMAMEKLGATSNAFTSNEYTGYYIKVPKANYTQALEILADIILHPVFDPAELTKESQVIAEEIKMYDDQPEEKVRQLFNSTLFHDSPYARDIAGDLYTIKNINIDTLHAFRNDNYRLNNCLLVTAGDFKEEENQSAIAEHFTFAPGNRVQESTAVSGRELNGKTVTIERPTQQLHLVLGGFAPSRGDSQEYALKLGNTILSGGFGSLLFQSLREKLGVSYYVHSNVTEYESIGKFAIRMGIDQTRFAETMEQLQLELKQFKQGKFTDDDFERAKNFLIGNYTTQLEATEDIAYWYGLRLLQRGTVLTYGNLVEKIAAVTKDEVVAAWNELLENQNLLLAALGPNVAELKSFTTSL